MLISYLFILLYFCYGKIVHKHGYSRGKVVDVGRFEKESRVRLENCWRLMKILIPKLIVWYVYWTWILIGLMTFQTICKTGLLAYQWNLCLLSECQIYIWHGNYGLKVDVKKETQTQQDLLRKISSESNHFYCRLFSNEMIYSPY